MATHDYNLANQDGASFRSDLNNALAAIVSNNSSSTAPATTFAHQIWVDTTANVIKQRNAANDAWVELWRIDGGFNAKTFSSNVTLNAQSDLRFADSDSSNWVAFQAPATVSSNVTWTLPSADGTADQALTTNGSGVLSWADAGGTTDNITEGNTSAEVVDTGSDGHFKVVTEGTEALRVDSSQRLGIGTASPGATLDVAPDSNRNLQVQGKSGTTYGLELKNGSANSGGEFHITAASSGNVVFNRDTNESARLDSSGRLLAGTSTARSVVMFNATTTTPTHQLETATNSWNNGLSIINNSSGGYTATLRLGTSGGNSIGSYTTSVSELGKVSFHGADGTRLVEAARIHAFLDGTAGNLDMPGRLMFATTADGASSPTERMRIKQNGTIRVNMADFGNDANGSNTGIEFTHGSFPRIVIATGDATSNQLVQFFNTNGAVGNISTSGSSTSYNTSSDYRLKENVVDLDGAIDRVKQLAPKRFNFIVDADTTVDGFLAHEAQTVVPEAVTGTHNEVDEEGNPVYQGIDQSKLVPLLTAALQEAIGKIETLETANAALEARLTALENA